jgi:hypothetical protein
MMKKFLLFVCAVVFLGSAVAQKRMAPSNLKAVPYKNTTHHELVVKPDNGLPTSNTLVSPVTKNRPKSTNMIVDTTWIGSSVNAYTLLVSQQRAIWYDKLLGAIMCTFRGNNSTTYPLLTYLTGNDVVNFFTTDLGTTFTKQQGVADGTRHRYPSGVIHNPVGNTDINNTYAVIAGPETNGTDWTYTYKVSVKHDGSDLDIQRTAVTPNGELLRQGLTATEDGAVHFCGDSYASDYTSSTLMTFNGTYNDGNTIDWTETDIIMDNYINRKTDNSLVSFFGDAHMAWNNDGSVGYTFVRGSDNRPTVKPSWVPILFKTTDGGATWDQLAYHDFAQDTALTNWILPTWKGDYTNFKPMFTDFGITVDYLNNPHIFAIVRGAAGRDVDSLTYIWTVTIGGVTHDADNNYVEVWIDSTDTWQARHIDTVWTDEVTETESNYTSSTGNVGWDHRMQASRSYDGRKVFGIWADSYYKFWGTDKFVLNPDIMMSGHAVKTGEMIYDTTATYGSDIWGISFFHFVSPVAVQKYDDVYDTKFEVPLTVADITSTGNNADNPVYHIWVRGLSMEFQIPDPHDAVNPKSNNKVSTLYPNPTSGTVHFDVTLDKPANVTVEVSNVTGQIVSTHDFGMLQTGKRSLTMNNPSLNSGVYICTFNLGNERVTKKMIVK